MGGAGAPDDLTLGHQTQVWLATSDDQAADVSGKFWYHQRTRAPAPAVGDFTVQGTLLRELERVTGEPFPEPATP